MKHENVFSSIVTKEDDFTELLVAMCRRFTILRKNLADLLVKKSPGHESTLPEDFEFEPHQISTQVVAGQENGRPDIVIETDNELLLIEVKIHLSRKLTSKQMSLYAKFMENEKYKQKHKSVFFLVPDDYHLDINGAIVLRWSELWEGTRDQGDIKEDSLYSEFFDFLHQSFIDTNYILRPSYLAALEQTAAMKALRRLIDFIDNVEKQIKDQGLVHVTKGREIHPYHYGCYISTADSRALIGYIGISWRDWKDQGMPIVIGLTEKHTHDSVLKYLYEEDGLFHHGINIEPLTAPDTLDRLSAKMNELFVFLLSTSDAEATKPMKLPSSEDFISGVCTVIDSLSAVRQFLKKDDRFVFEQFKIDGPLYIQFSTKNSGQRYYIGMWFGVSDDYNGGSDFLFIGKESSPLTELPQLEQDGSPFIIGTEWCFEQGDGWHHYPIVSKSLKNVNLAIDLKKLIDSLV